MADEERWAEALAIQKLYGTLALVYVAERIGVLGTAGDAAAVERFKEIARRLDQLLHAEGTQQ